MGQFRGRDLTLEKALALRDRFRGENRGPHMLTGPIAVETAEPGDILKVEIERLEISDHGINLIPGQPSRGLLADSSPTPSCATSRSMPPP